MNVIKTKKRSDYKHFQELKSKKKELKNKRRVRLAMREIKRYNVVAV